MSGNWDGRKRFPPIDSLTGIQNFVLLVVRRARVERKKNQEKTALTCWPLSTELLIQITLRDVEKASSSLSQEKEALKDVDFGEGEDRVNLFFSPLENWTRELLRCDEFKKIAASGRHLVILFKRFESRVTMGYD